jgi:hypothetical protein
MEERPNVFGGIGMPMIFGYYWQGENGGNNNAVGDNMDLFPF